MTGKPSDKPHNEATGWARAFVSAYLFTGFPPNASLFLAI